MMSSSRCWILDIVPFRDRGDKVSVARHLPDREKNETGESSCQDCVNICDLDRSIKPVTSDAVHNSTPYVTVMCVCVAISKIKNTHIQNTSGPNEMQASEKVPREKKIKC